MGKSLTLFTVNFKIISKDFWLFKVHNYWKLFAVVEKAMAPTPVLLPGKSHGRRSLVGCSPWTRWESGTTERFHFLFSLSCIGEGNGNPPQCSCPENPRDGEAWWAAVYGIKWLSSSSSVCCSIECFTRFTL